MHGSNGRKNTFELNQNLLPNAERYTGYISEEPTTLLADRYYAIVEGYYVEYWIQSKIRFSQDLLSSNTPVAVSKSNNCRTLAENLLDSSWNYFSKGLNINFPLNN